MNLLKKTLCLSLLTVTSAVSAKETPVSITVDKIQLHGTLSTPDHGKSVASAVIIAGSGPTDRNGNSRLLPGNNDSLKMLANGLAAQSITTLRFDKRMIGESTDPTLSEPELRFDHYVNDAIEWAKHLEQTSDQPAWLIGHSEGAHIAMVAAAERDFAGLVVLAGPGQHPADLIAQQLSVQLPAPLLAQSKDILTSLRNGETVEDTPPMLAALFRPSVQPYVISWFAHDPVETFESVEEPALLVFGTTDIQVPTSDGELLANARDDAKFAIIDGMNHILKSVGADPSAQQSSYADPSLPLHDALIPTITDFVLAHTR
ncbi:MAG: alpha/beta hydrolase [Woeseiaceae bacterium]